MPLNATSTQVLQSADTWEVTRVIIETASQELIIVYRYGLKQPGGSVQWKQDNLSFSVDAKALARTNPIVGETWYGGIKRLVYSLGQTAGKFPAGTVT